MPEFEFKLGDVVRFRSGGAAMTVLGLDEFAEVKKCYCLWMLPDSETREQWFPEFALCKASTVTSDK